MKKHLLSSDKVVGSRFHGSVLIFGDNLLELGLPYNIS